MQDGRIAAFHSLSFADAVIMRFAQSFEAI